MSIELQSLSNPVHRKVGIYFLLKYEHLCDVIIVVVLFCFKKMRSVLTYT